MSGRVDSASRLIRASASAIYEAFTKPEALEEWLPPHGMSGHVLAFAFHEGGAYRIRLTYDEPQHAAAKTSHDADEVEVRFVRLVPDQRIQQEVTFESGDEAFSGVMRILWTFTPVEDGTVVAVHCEDVPVGIRAEDHEAGLKSSLENLAAFTESSR